MEQTVSQLLFIAGEYTTCCYLGLLLLAIVSERRLTSVSVTMAVVALSACVASLAVTPLYKWASDEHVLSKFSWYGSWMVLNLLALWLLISLHRTLGLRVSRMGLASAAALVLLVLLQAIDFIDVATVQSNLFAPIYQLGVLSVNVGLIPLLLFYWLQELSIRKSIRLGAV
ncbi:MAG: hypothetical protein J0M22_05670 [Gammaproteobacteria bacterium]|jgi:hypothetical protein|nr:hypothetical protein [Gammaproteobacteria bacterium]